jgi:hypothetical protein
MPEPLRTEHQYFHRPYANAPCIFARYKWLCGDKVISYGYLCLRIFNGIASLSLGTLCNTPPTKDDDWTPVNVVDVYSVLFS